ncbi:MAG: hypothetical protein FWC45_01650 [Treponema sp.]|nr:hypothetical protein [Treponema sp.]
MSEYKYELDTQSKLVHAKREGIKEGELKIIDLLKNGKSPEEIIKAKAVPWRKHFRGFSAEEDERGDQNP